MSDFGKRLGDVRHLYESSGVWLPEQAVLERWVHLLMVLPSEHHRAAIDAAVTTGKRGVLPTLKDILVEARERGWVSEKITTGAAHRMADERMAEAEAEEARRDRRVHANHIASENLVPHLCSFCRSEEHRIGLHEQTKHDEPDDPLICFQCVTEKLRDRMSMTKALGDKPQRGRTTRS